ncbi:MAG: extracellular solute-binding protein [Vallitaleaceae bacterium]|jgi:raffinose/stachyose/melibiose transport system substrate-binding protein|nr:extracellular solute-binding protein [Vallitaleaceae bacterium]
MKQKGIVILLVLSLLVTLFVGCSTKEEAGDTAVNEPAATTTDTEPAADTSAPAEIDTKVLTIMASQDWIQEAEIELGLKFEEETGIQVDYQIIPSDQYFNVLLTKLNSNEALDIFMSQSGKFDIQSQLNITENGVPLTDEAWAADFDKLVAEQVSVDGVLYGQTVSDVYSVWSVAYNKKIYADLGLSVPKTYDEFKSNCQAILDSGITPVYECVADGWHHSLWWHEVGPQYEVLEPGMVEALNNNEKTLADFTGPEKALEQIKEMVDLGYWGEDYMSNQFANMPSAVASGDYAMALGAISFGTEVEAQGLDLKEEDIGFFVIPLLDNQTINLNPAGPSRFIYSGSENIEAAKLYMDFVVRTDNLQYILDNSARYSNLPFAGLKTKYTDNINQIFDSYTNSGTVLQTAVTYINPQWMDTSSDITSLLLDVSTPADVLAAVDKRRADQADAAGDPAWAE